MDSTNLPKVAEPHRHDTSKSDDAQTIPEEYADRVKKGRNGIYCITGEDSTAVSSSPLLENLRKKSSEVVCMADPVDEDGVHQLTEFNDKKLRSTINEG